MSEESQRLFLRDATGWGQSGMVTVSGPLGPIDMCQHDPEPDVEVDDTDAQRIERLRAEVVAVRNANEMLRRERVEVEQALGRSIHEGQLGPAVRMAIYRETGR
jgi:hypothetical protein